MEQAKVIHTSVLLNESIKALSLTDGDIVIDGTFGGGGHTGAILASRKNITVISVDLDEHAQVRWQEKFSNNKQSQFVRENFKNASAILEKSGQSVVTKVLLDLGTSAYQLLEDDRGFSFNSDAPLRMAYSKQGSHTGFDASEIVNTWDEESIADVIYHYGDEPKARRIAKAIVAQRNHGVIKTGKELGELIEQAIGRRGRIHPATKTFQALRIAVNDELAVIQEALGAWLSHLASGGIIAIITFHSIEDRTVKHWIKHKSSLSHIRVITKKPIVPTRKELLENPRARSAKLRVIQKI